MMKVRLIMDPEFVATIKARSIRAPERDHTNVTCWREGSVEHYFIGEGYLHSIPYMPLDPKVLLDK